MCWTYLRTGLFVCKPKSTPIEQSPPFWETSSPFLKDLGQYRRLIGKLIYLIVTRPDICYAVGLLSQFMHKPQEVHLQGALRVLAYVKEAPGKGFLYKNHGHLDVATYFDSGYANDKGDRKSTSGFCTYVGGNLVTWRSNKKNVVSRSSVEAEYRSMAQTACEMIWVQSLLSELGFPITIPMQMLCDNQTTIFIANNPTFHECTKHVEVDCHTMFVIYY